MTTEMINGLGSEFCAKKVLSNLGIKWAIRFQQEGRLLRHRMGIPIYYKNAEGDDLACYTPATGSLIIFSAPRWAGIDGVGSKYE